MYNSNNLISKELEAFTLNEKELRYVNRKYPFSGKVLFATIVKDGNIGTYNRIYKNINTQLMDLGMISCGNVYWSDNVINLSYINNKTEYTSNFHLIIQYKE